MAMWLVFARLRGEHRQIELMDLSLGKLTSLTTEATDHWNPDISPDGRLVVFHKSTSGLIIPNVERWGAPPGTDLQTAASEGSFSVFLAGRPAVGPGGRFDQSGPDGQERQQPKDFVHRP